MRKLLSAAALAIVAIAFVPGHADPTNQCYAADNHVPGSQGGAIKCSYTAGVATGQIVQATPNQIHISETSPDGLTTHDDIWSQDSLSIPGKASFAQTPGWKVSVVVGPDDASPAPISGAIGLVVAGDAS
jgi:hypothetical protein